MVVILCHPDDDPALWLDDRWRRAGVRGVELISVEQLAFSRRIVHRLATSGDAAVVHLADGRVLRLDGIRGLMNRVRYIPASHFARASPSDRSYATTELGAWLLAWLNGVAGRVINPALPASLGGGTFRSAAVMHLAAAAGLPTEPWRASADPDAPLQPIGARREDAAAIVVFDGQLFGASIPDVFASGCVRLAALLGVPLLELRFARRPGHRWRFAGATGLVDYRIGGPRLALAIARSVAAGSP